MAHARQLGIGIVHQGAEQFRKPPGMADRLLKVEQVDAKNLFLCGGAAQRFVGLLPVTDFDGQFGGKAPQQNLGQIMQQSRQRDLFDVHVMAFEGPAMRVVGSALGTADDLKQPEQGLRLVFQCGFQRERGFKFFEEGLNAEHHDGIADRGDVRAQAIAAK